jgi:outer membrane protein
MKTSMKKFIKLSLVVMAFFSLSSLSAQKYAYVDSEYILNNVPEYQDAQIQLDELSEKLSNK